MEEEKGKTLRAEREKARAERKAVHAEQQASMLPVLEAQVATLREQAREGSMLQRTVATQEANITRMPGNLLLDGLRRGDGIVATVPRFIEDDLKAGRLVILFEDRLDAGYHIVTRPGVQRAPLQTFIRWLHSVC